MVIVMIFSIGFRIVNVSGSSMQPTLATNDRLIISNIAYQPQIGDIIVSVQDNAENEPIIKRVIALAGQEVDIDYEANIIYVDGKAINDDYTLQPGRLEELHPINQPIELPCTVPEGMVFVLGDNRNNSLDSRSQKVGMIEERYILGKAVLRIFPFDRIGVPDDLK